MITVKWPKTHTTSDDVVVDWLEDLCKLNPKAEVFQFVSTYGINDQIMFCREEDAIAFKLRFGL